MECTPVDGVQLPLFVFGDFLGLAGALPPSLGDLGPSLTVPLPSSSTFVDKSQLEGRACAWGPAPRRAGRGKPGGRAVRGRPAGPNTSPPPAPGPGPAAMPPCLVLVDPSPAATGALRWAANNLDVGAQAIHLVHVVTPKPMVVAGGMGAGMLVEAIHEEVRRPPVLPRPFPPGG